ncbi:hypothetical protein BOVATA_016660 [Babesia ovata]|uniref:Uncharacterized protein n=1 Tax=Babesia ovata TaxID=189622 RepID=A0A2H6KB00_9APIC|nr:uncharacterized protein BOVATA_016660 [Babesia ovata]GBE60173.1 hypothetical protein BOVATA_016660 [Babesia ovata]
MQRLQRLAAGGRVVQVLRRGLEARYVLVGLALVLLLLLSALVVEVVVVDLVLQAHAVNRVGRVPALEGSRVNVVDHAVQLGGQHAVVARVRRELVLRGVAAEEQAQECE